MTDASIPTSPPPPPPPAPPPAPADPMTPDIQDILKHRPMAILSYVGPLVLIPFLTTRNSPFVKFHSQQGLRLFIWEIVATIAIAVYWSLGKLAIYLLPSVALWFWANGGACLGATLGLAAYVTGLVLSLIGIIGAANGRARPLPLIAKLPHPRPHP